MNDDFEWQPLKALLPDVQVTVLDEVGSTNTYALESVRHEQCSTPALIIAHRQTAGRGQQGRSWFSSAGGIAMSIVLRGGQIGFPVLPPGLLAAAAGVSVAQVLQELAPPDSVSIKWPNDVLLQGRKVAGILIESCSTSGFWYHVIGIGINVAGSFPKSGPGAELRDRAIHVQDLLSQNVDRLGLVVSIVRRLREEYADCETHPEEVAERFNQLHVFHNQWLTIADARVTNSGWCRGLNASGELCLETATGGVNIASGSVIRVP
ncbi:MAG TPA: biotin--[acetyl-CoA-carboxylase] ligase [Pirellulaceae bacterium]|nr:biotin--[acetyl-CoA-carboxylase] ligase [Pirellulaceae bacterium]